MRSGFAVGLSAISFSAMLQKDAASIPNALGAVQTTEPPYILINKVYLFSVYYLCFSTPVSLLCFFTSQHLFFTRMYIRILYRFFWSFADFVIFFVYFSLLKWMIYDFSELKTINFSIFFIKIYL